MWVDELQPRRKGLWTEMPETWVGVQTPSMKCAGLDMSPVQSCLSFWIDKRLERGREGKKESGGMRKRESEEGV